MKYPVLGSLAAACIALAHPAAQSNQDPGIDVRLSAIGDVRWLGRTGDFPDGMNGMAVATTVCNQGTLEVPWFQPMNPAHPKIAFLVASVRDGRIVQISDRSYLKHGFFAANANACPTSCVQPSDIGKYLGIGCSDTYAISNNGDHYYLGPPEEVDPWLGSWTRVGSLFDRGLPDVGAPANADGNRSFTRAMANALGPVGSRVHVSDEDFLLGGDLHVQAQYIVAGLPDAGRDDSLGYRPFTAAWDGTRWVLTKTGTLVPGSILQAWPGAILASGKNGEDDGRVFVAVKVSGPVEGFYHYEYAIHNRDNARGIGALRIPVCSGARVRAVGFRDIDKDAANDWTSSLEATALVVGTSTSPLLWNTIENLWFDCDAAPADATLSLAEFAPGAGLPEFGVPSLAPMALFNVVLGPGCALDAPPTLYTIGDPPRATLGNASFGLASSGNVPGEPNLLLLGMRPGSRALGGCTLWTGSAPALVVSRVTSGPDGVARHPGPIPSSAALEGKAFRLQAIGRDPGHGRIYSSYELSEGLLVRLGNAIPACP